MIKLIDQIKVASGKKEPDLVVKNVNLINVFSNEIYKTDIAIYKDRIAGIGEYKARNCIDGKGLYASPGLIDSHIHIESSMTTIPYFARAVVPHGTTTVIIDPHEIANVLGLDGINYMLKSSKYNPLSVYLMLPSCVPATNMETSGSELRALDLYPYLRDEWVLGIGEMMNFPGIVNGDRDILDKITLGRSKIVDGHCPLLKGKELNAYISAGIYSDHECSSIAEAKEKLRKGMWIMIREGSTAKNLETLLPLINKNNMHRIMFCSDDKHPHDILEQGHIDYILRRTVKFGIDPIDAVRIASLNPAIYFDLRDIGALAPGYKADIVLFKDLKKFQTEYVIKNGEVVVKSKKYIDKKIYKPKKINIRSSLNTKWLSLDDFKIKSQKRTKKSKATCRVIELVKNEIITKTGIEKLDVIQNEIQIDIERDILKIAVIDRHYATEKVGLALVKGFGLKRGAIGSTVAHDSHNIIIVGTNDNDMLRCVLELKKMNGGLCAVLNDKLVYGVALPIAGLMAEEEMEVMKTKLEKLIKKTNALGTKIANPFLAMAFLSLPVIPELKITNLGLVDVNNFKFVDIVL